MGWSGRPGIYKKNSVGPALRGLPVFGSSGKLGMQNFGMESAAHLRQVCLIVFINLFFFFYWPASGSCVHFISLGAAAPLLRSLSLFPFL